MELNEVILILGVFLPLLLVAIWQLNRVNPIKKAAKAGDSSIKELYSVHNEQVSDILKLKDKQISSLSAKLRLYEEEPEEEEPEPIADLIKSPEIQSMLKEKGINPTLLNNPVIQKYIKKYTKGMSIEQVLEIAQQFGLLKGSKEPQSETNPTLPLGYNPNWA